MFRAHQVQHKTLSLTVNEWALFDVNPVRLYFKGFLGLVSLYGCSKHSLIEQMLTLGHVLLAQSLP